MVSARTAHVPIRRCLGCGQRFPKGALARFTVRREGDIWCLVRDDVASLGGRGLYVCPSDECFQRAVVRRAFARGARIRGELRIDSALGASLGEGD